MLESNSGALNTAQEDAARIAMLEGEVAQLRRRDAERNAELDARERRIRLLEEALRILQSNRFGSSREKLHVAPGQAELFNEAETVAELNEVLGTEVSLKATPQRVDKATAGTKAGRKAIASHLPRMPVVHDVPEAERLCACGVTLVEIGSDVTEQLDYVPPKIQVLQHVRKKYACPGCDQCVKTAPLPPQILPRSNAAPGLLAHLVTSKYVDAMPLYRQETIFARYGVSLPRATQAAWIIALAEKIQPLINLMDERLRSSGYIRIDETPVQVLKSDRPAEAEHWMWVRVAGPPRQRIILFDYDPSRGTDAAGRLLDGAHGIIQSDGHYAYDHIARQSNLIHCGCIAHLRRKFFDAIKALPRDVRKQSTAAHEAVRRIDELYAIEREIDAMTDAERVAVRREKSLPRLESLQVWAMELLTSTLASGKLGEALVYLRNQWPKLIRYVDHGEAAIDTNLAENAIRPFALGRRNWMFADTVSGAKASASLYSLVQTARANEIEPYAYLRRMLAELPKAQTVEQIEALLPWDIKTTA